MINFFDDDAFSTIELTDAINLLPLVESRLSRLLQFRGVPLLGDTAAIELKHGTLGLVPTAARGTMPNVLAGERRVIKKFDVPYIPLNSSVLATDVAGLRAFGEEEALEALSEVMNDKLERMKQDLDVTLEYHRAGCVSGVILDADGTTVLVDLFDSFGVVEDEVDFDFSTDDMKAKSLEVIRGTEDDLGNTPYTQVVALCGDEFFDGFISSDSVKDAYALAADREFFTQQQAAVGGNERGFEFGGILWHNYRGKVGDVSFIATDEARFFPTGVPQLFNAYYAPAPFEDTVGKRAVQFYAKQEKMKWGLGTELHANTSTLYMCTRPKLLKKGTM